jgi:RimJ/RimL family protein N-acetyltransferase/L-amino acid N-acyltransferase YncA
VPGPDPLPRAGARVVLRRLRRDDLPAFQAYRHDAEVGRWQGWSPQTDAEALAFLDDMAAAPLFAAGEWVQLAIADRATDRLAGDLGVCVAADGAAAEIGFTLAPRFQRQGLATEALREATALVFAHATAERVVCITDARNAASVRVLERAGMRRTATADAVFRGAPCVEHTYELRRDAAGRAGAAASPLAFRPAVPEDIAACVDLRGRTRENAVSAERLAAAGITAASWADDVRCGRLAGHVCVRTEDGALAGYCFGDNVSGEVVVLAVLPEHEFRGVGRRLLAAVAEHLAGRGHRRLFLGCAADPTTRSHGFYRHLGWASTGRFDASGDEILEFFPTPAPLQPSARE